MTRSHRAPAAVLLDCAEAGHAIGADALERAAEGLDLTAGDVILIRTGEFAFACLPLKLRWGTGSPVRPIALV